MNRFIKRCWRIVNNERGFVGTSIAIATAVGSFVTAGIAVGGTAAVIGGAALAAGAYGIKSLLTGAKAGPQMQQYQAPQMQTAQETVKASQETAEAERKKVMARRSKTVLTGPLGTSEEANTAKKTLLGS